jgi:hypothetical protein
MRRAALMVVASFSLAAQTPPKDLVWSSLASQDQDFAQMIVVLAPAHRLAVDSVRNKLFADLYLLSAIPVVPTSGPPPKDEAYFKTEQPAGGLITSFLHRRHPPTPHEHLLVYLRVVSPGKGVFRCDQFALGQQRSHLCDGDVDLTSGTVTFTYLDTLLDRTVGRLQMNDRCESDLTASEESVNECKTKSIGEKALCNIVSNLYARFKCRGVSTK